MSYLERELRLPCCMKSFGCRYLISGDLHDAILLLLQEVLLILDGFLST